MQRLIVVRPTRAAPKSARVFTWRRTCLLPGAPHHSGDKLCHSRQPSSSMTAALFRLGGCKQSYRLPPSLVWLRWCSPSSAQRRPGSELVKPDSLQRCLATFTVKRFNSGGKHLKSSKSGRDYAWNIEFSVSLHHLCRSSTPWSTATFGVTFFGASMRDLYVHD